MKSEPLSSTKVVAEIAAERTRQIEREGWTVEHDDEHEAGALSSAAACYAHRAQFELRPKNDGKPPPELDIDDIITRLWPFDEEWWKPKGARRDLIRAAALIVAEIERLDRLANETVARTADEKLAIALAALRQIANMEDESDEWDGAARYTNCRNFAQQALKNMGEPNE